MMRRAEITHRDVGLGFSEPLLEREGNVRLSDTRLSGQQHEAALTARGLVPATQQQINFLVSTDRWCHPGLVLRFKAAFHAARPQRLPSRLRLRPSLEHGRTDIPVFEMPLGQPARLVTDQHSTGHGERLQARGQVRRLADDRLFLGGAFAGQIADHHHSGRDADTNLKPGADISLEVGHGVHQPQPRAYCLLGIILVRLRKAEISECPVSHVAGDDPTIRGDDVCNAGVINADDRAQVFRIKAGRKCRRPHQIAKHDRELTPLGALSWGRLGCRLGCPSGLCSKLGGRAQNLAPMTQQDPKILQVLLRKIANDRKVDAVLNETLGVLAQADRC